MRRLVVSLALLSISARAWAADAAVSASATEAPRTPVPADARQLLVVQSPSWGSVTGVLQRYERSQGEPWTASGASAPVNLGRNGMAWGRGLQGEQPGPAKREGDQKSPAGVFALGTAFGYQQELPEGSKSYPYLHIRLGVSCVEDRNSKFYNQIVEPTVKARDWAGQNEMLRGDGLFRWGVLVLQNAVDTTPGAGSCIFLHIWRGLGKGTAGCTATAPAIVEETVRWLDPAGRPVLVQLPEAEYARLRSSWILP